MLPLFKSFLAAFALCCAFAFEAYAQSSAAFPSLAPLKSFIVQEQSQSLVPPAGVRSSTAGGKWDIRTRSYASDEQPEDSYRMADLVYAMPGSLEPKDSGPGFHFAFDEQLGLSYAPGSFAFSGRADSLFWQPQTGWGSENINQDMLPLLLRRDYQAVDEPCYEFFWQRPANAPVPGGFIYLNCVFKVPKQSRLVGHEELNVKRQYFDRSFSSEAPHVLDGQVFIWDSGSLYSYDAALSSRDSAKGWESLPSDFQATSFALSADGKQLVMASASLNISGFAAGDGASAPKWTVKGAGPVIVAGKFAFSMTQDYSAIQAIRLSDGRAAQLYELPRYLPRTPNSFALAKLGGRDCLFLLVPAQSKTLVFEIK